MSSVEERFSAALHATARGWRLAVDRRLKDSGVSQAGWMTIAVVAKARSPLSQSELAQQVGVEGATMVSMLDRLAAAGLIVRVPSASDRRVKRVQLTDAGNALFDQVRGEAGAVRKALLAGIDPQVLLTATQLLERLQGALEDAV